MKAKQISETTFKITISIKDLEDRGLELTDFIMPQERTEEFFYAMLEEVDLPDTFKQSGMLSFRVTPKPDKVDIFVTMSEVATDFSMADLSNFEDLAHLTPEEIFKKIEQKVSENGDSEALQRLAQAEEQDMEEADEPEIISDFTHYVLSFEQLSDVIAFAKMVDYPVEAAELYKFQGTYRLTVLIYVKNQPEAYPHQIYARLLVHATESAETRAYLREHAILLREGDVLAELASIRG